MIIICSLANENGYRPPLQTWEQSKPPINFAVVPENIDTSVFYEYNGFVVIETEKINEKITVTSMKPNIEAWETWKNNDPNEPIVVDERD
jgi:hypothetical protein